jgi:hypothetical protein
LRLDAHAATFPGQIASYTSDTVTITVAGPLLRQTLPTWIRVEDLATTSRAPQGINDYSDSPFNATGTSESTPRLMAPTG